MDRRPAGRLLALVLAIACGPAAAASLEYSTHLGGTDDESEIYYQGIVGIAVDAAGNRYVTGTTRSTDFPTTPGATRTIAGGTDVFVTKLSPAGDVVYSTYLGGPCDDTARDVAVDAAGNAYVTGRVHGGVCLDDVRPGVLVAKLAPSGAVLYASSFGGSMADVSIGQAIAVDAQGQAYVTGIAQSSSRDFPTTPGAFRTTDCGDVWLAAGGDGFVAKLAADGGTLLWSTILCGSAHDSPNDVAIDAGGHAYVAGSTESTDFPTVAPLQAAHRGGPTSVTGFVAKLRPDGSGLVWSTYLGGSTNESIGGIALDGQANVYVTGGTESSDFPTTAGVLQPEAGNRLCFYELCSDAFVTKLDASGAAIAYSTHLFGEADDTASRIAVDAAGNAHVVGSTSSLYFPIVDAFQPATGGLRDAYVATLSADGSRLLSSSYLGGTRADTSPRIGWDMGSAIALDVAGNAHVAGYTQSLDFPTTPDAFQPALSGLCDGFGTPCGDAFVATIGAGGPGAAPPVSVSATPDDVAFGGTLTATWSGIPAPTTRDALRLYTLGKMAGDYDEVASWPTGGGEAGQASLPVPLDLAPGWYELRLLSPDPESTLLTVVARSEPIRVGAGTTPPPATPLCEVVGPSACDDGDPCTEDACLPAQGCVSTPASGFDSVTCTCRRARSAACDGERVPRSLERRRGRACTQFDGAAGTAAPQKRLRRAVATLAGSLGTVAKARRKGKISSGCAAALEAELRDARDRATQLLASVPRS